jgi:nitroreductase
MIYKGFFIDAFEQEPGKWRARVTRANGRPSRKSRRRRRREFVTSVDQSSAVEAMKMAMEAVDAGSFFRNVERRAEKFWRLSTSSD